MLMDMVDGFELEVRDALTPKDDGGATQKQVLPGSKEAALADMGVAVLKQGLTKGPLSHDPEWFNKDDNYATAVQQALDLQLDVVPFVHLLAKQASAFPGT